MTNNRNGLLLLSLLMTALLSSCWDNFEERSYYSANVTAFGFSEHDTCPDIENYVFNIDQFKGISADTTTGVIFNLDSLPYGSVVNTLYPDITFQSTNGNIYLNDSLWEDDEDSTDFTGPVVLKNTSYDGNFSKWYTIFVNVHQVDPDSMLLEPMAVTLPQAVGFNKVMEADGYLYDYSLDGGTGLKAFRSADTSKTWTSLAISGLSGDLDLLSLCRFMSSSYLISKTHQAYVSPDGLSWTAYSPKAIDETPVTLLSLYGEISRKYRTDSIPSVLAGVLITSTGDTVFATSADGISWKTGISVPEDFPLKDYALASSKTVTGIQSLTVCGGLNASDAFSSSVWSTEDGKNWVLINDGSTSWFSAPKRKNPVLFNYDNKLVCFGGTDEDGAYCKDIRVSPDHGNIWTEAPDNWEYLNMTHGLAGAGIYVQRIPASVYQKTTVELAGTGVYVQCLPDTANDKEREFIWIMGGERSDGPTSTIWKAYLNKMVFARR
jgi:hypothetical protein